MTRCHCGAPAVEFRAAGFAAALIHDLSYGCGMYLAPGEGYLIPVCAEHRVVSE